MDSREALLQEVLDLLRDVYDEAIDRTDVNYEGTGPNAWGHIVNLVRPIIAKLERSLG